MKLFNGKQQQANIINDRFPSNKSIFGDLCANIYPNPVTFPGGGKKGSSIKWFIYRFAKSFSVSCGCGNGDGDDELA